MSISTPSPEQVLALLADAFPALPIDATAYARENGAWDGYIYCEAFDREVQGRTWNVLGSRFADAHGSALFHLDPAPFVAVLPAYLAALVRDEIESQSCAYIFSHLTRSRRPEQFDARMALLTIAQRRAVASVLQRLLDNRVWNSYEPDIAAALEDWR